MSTPSSTPPGEDPREATASDAASPAGPVTGTSRNVPSGSDSTSSDARTPNGGHHIDPARLEVRVRRLALLGLVLVPFIYLIVQSLR